jgi:cytochrome b subunit of formate dehydrogenase
MSNTGERTFYRLTLHQRIQHVVAMVAFSVQVLTGFPLKFAGAAWSYPLIKLFGGVYMAGRIHRVAGMGLLLISGYHLTYVVVTTIQKIIVMFQAQPAENSADAMKRIAKLIYNLPMFPKAKDATDIGHFFAYAFFLTDKRPDYGKFCWKEKFEYFGFLGGGGVVVVSGLVLWYPSFWTFIGMPARAINIMYALHTNEAVLALLVIAFWHFYCVIFAPEKFPMDSMVVDGCISEEHMIEEHPAEYRRILMEEGEDSPSIVKPEE